MKSLSTLGIPAVQPFFGVSKKYGWDLKTEPNAYGKPLS